MQELVEKILIYLRGIWRHRWYALVSAWLVCLLGWAAVFMVPNTYESTATVYVDTDSMLRPLLRGLTVDIDVAEKLGIMAKRLLSRPNLERVAKMADLDHDAKTDAELDQIVRDLERNIVLREMRSTRHTPRPEPPDLYVIGARNTDPQRAQRIVEALLETFVEDTVGDHRSRTEMAERFLDQQIREYEQKLTDAEDRLREFKRANIDVLPDQEQSYYQRLQTARSELERVELSLREARFRRNELQMQLQGTPTSQRAVGADGSVAQTPTEERLLTLQRRLDELLLKYTEEHPDVVETKRSIEALLKQLESERNAMQSGEQPPGAAPNPLHQQIRLALGEVEAEIAALQVRREEFRNRVERLQEQIETLPQVEAELQRLNRNYEIYREQYNTLVSRRESAKISEEVEQTGEDLKFRVIEPPRMPVKPISPNRLMLTAAVMVFGVGAGLGVGFLLSQLRPAVYGRRMLREISGLPVFGAVSYVWTARAKLKQRLEAATVLVLAGLILPATVVVAYLQIKGIGGGL